MQMPLFLKLPALTLLLAASLAHAQHTLPAPVRAALARAQVPRDAVAALVVDADGRAAPRLAWRAQAPMNPASVMKLVTSVAALDLLGPAFVWRTPVYADGTLQDDGTLQGNLYLKGQGDPQLVLERLWLLLRHVRDLGIRRVSGDVVLDHSALTVPPQDPGAFDGEPLRPYNVAPDALLINYQTLTLRLVPDGAGTRTHVSLEPPLAGVQWPATVPLSAAPCGDDWRGALQADFSDPLHIRLNGSYPAACGERTWPVAYAEPGRFAARAIAGLWRELGGQIDGQVRDGAVPPGLTPLLEARSPPLAEVLRDMNKYSNNVMAQQIFLTLGLTQRGAGTFEAAREVVGDWWRERIGGGPPVLDNGAGLSRNARVSAQALARLLQIAWAAPLMPELVASLPITGVDGTLRHASARTGAAHLKTGSLRDVAGVAGYVDGVRGQRWVLVMIANHPNAAAARPAFDALADWAAALHPPGGTRAP